MSINSQTQSSNTRIAKLPIKHDQVSVILCLINILLFTEFAISQGPLASYATVALGLTLAGLLMSGFQGVFQVFKQAPFDQKQLLEVGVVILVLYISNIYVPKLPLGVTIPDFSGNYFSEVSFLTMIAISEECFFRLLLGNYLILKAGKYAGSLMDGAIAIPYHFFVYGTQPLSLIIIFIMFTLFTFIAADSGRVSTSMYAHIINNFLSAGKVQSGAVIWITKGASLLLKFVR